MSCIHNRDFFTSSVSKCCPKGSILGPLFWDIIFDSLLRILLPEGCRMIAFANDLVLLIRANSRRELERLLAEIMPLLEEWARKMKMEFSASKTVGMMLKERLDAERPPTARLNGRAIRFVTEHKYLGVLIDRARTFLA